MITHEEAREVFWNREWEFFEKGHPLYVLANMTPVAEMPQHCLEFLVGWCKYMDKKGD